MPGRQRILGDRQVAGQRQRILGDRSVGGTTRTRVGQQPPPPPAAPHHDGVLGTIGHVFAQGGADLKNAALQAPGGLVHLADAARLDFQNMALHPSDHSKKSHLIPLAQEMAQATADTLRHPLRHPGDTLLLGLPAVGGAARTVERAGAVRASVKAGEGVRGAVRAATAPVEVGQRTLNVGGLEVRGHYSRAAGSRAVQKATDAALQRGAEMPNRAGVLIENRLHKRAAKWNDRNQKTADAVARAPGTRLEMLGQKLKPDELRALRLVAEETPVARRLGAQEMRMARATGKEVARHQERIDVTKAAMQHLDAHPTTGAPVFKPEAAKLRSVFEQLKATAGDREGMLKQLGLLDQAAQDAAKTKVAQVAAGAEYVSKEAANARLRQIESGLTSLQHEADQLANRAQRKAVQGDKLAARHDRNAQRATVAGRVEGQLRDAQAVLAEAWQARNAGTLTDKDFADLQAEVTRLHRQNSSGLVSGARAQKLAADLARVRSEGTAAETAYKTNRAAAEAATSAKDAIAAAGGRVVGAEDIVASPDAVFIGNPVERSRLTGKPKVSSTGTLGHTQKPSSLRASTGASVEHALERGDVTRIVAERHAEVVRLTKIDRLVQSVKKTGEHSPRRKDDVWVWTDKLVSNERIPKDVRRYLDNPEGIAKLAPDEQQSVLQQIKDATFEQHDWRDPQAVADFEKLAADGKGVFVPRRLLGDAAKRGGSLDAVPPQLLHFVDTVNNAQKTGLVYLKLNYPLIQAFSNAAMGVIQQGFAYPVNLTRAIRLDNKIGPDMAAVVDDIMGQGAVVQAAFEGQGAVANITRQVAHAASHYVDTPARRASFLHEAAKAGYRTPEQVTQLLTNDRFAGDLAEVAQRAKEAIVIYDEMSPFERSVVRRLLFVYPWQKGATKYAGHFLRDHPVQAAAASQLAEQGKQQSNSAFGPVPSYLEGLIPVGGRAVNPAGVNFFQTPAQIGEAAAGLVTGDPAQRGAGLGFLAPAPGVVAGLLSGHDNIGRPLTSNLAGNVRDLTYGQTSAAALARAAAGRYDPVRKAVGSRTSSKSFPDPNDAYWRFVLGGLYPRRYDKGALNQNAARQKTGR